MTSATTTELAIQAINTRETMSFNYDNKPRHVEVHAIGVGGKGEIMRAWQLSPEPTWRLFSVEKIEAPQLSLLTPSQAPRPGYNLHDSAMITIHAQVQP